MRYASLTRILCVLTLVLSVPAQALTVTFSEAELQEKVDQVMPLVKQTMFATVTLNDPVLTLAEDANEIELQLNLQLIMAGITQPGSIALAGQLSYDEQQAAFYVTNMRVLDVQIKGMPTEFTPQIIMVAEQLVNPVLASTPVYRLQAGLTQTMIKSVLESIEVRDKQLVATLKVI